MRTNSIKEWSAEKISQRVFYVLIAIAVIVFALFFLIGYDMPFEENPDFNAPLFTNVLIVLMWILFAAALILAIVSVVRSYRNTAKQEEKQNGIPENKIFRTTWLGTLLLLVITFVTGSAAPLAINGNEYNEWTWLKASDMFVNTSIAMLLLAFGAVAYGATRYIRKDRKK